MAKVVNIVNTEHLYNCVFCVDDSYQNEGKLSSADYFLDFLLLGYSIQEAVGVLICKMFYLKTNNYISFKNEIVPYRKQPLRCHFTI